MEQTPVAPPPNPATVPKPASARSAGTAASSNQAIDTRRAEARSGLGRHRYVRRQQAGHDQVSAKHYSGRDAAEGEAGGIPALLSAAGFGAARSACA